MTMTDAGKGGTGQAVLGRGWLARRRGLLAVVIVVVAVWLGFALTGSKSESVGRPASPTETVADPTVPPGRRYTDEKLGLDEFIDEYVEIMMTPVDTRFRSSNDRGEYRAERNRYFEHEATGHERERLHFERNLTLVFDHAYDDLPADPGVGGLLDQAFEDAMDRCAQARGWPSVQLYGVSKADVEQFEADLGLSLDEFLDLRHECAQQAASYPTLDSVVRDELLGRLGEHYRAAVYEYLLEFADAEVPLVDHEGAPRPLEERLINICLKDPDPAQCAAEFRVELPAE